MKDISIYNKLFLEYSKLGLDKKRDIFNEELIKITYIINNYLNKFNLENIEEPYNYKEKIDSKVSESELIDLNFKNLYNIKSKLLVLLSLIDNGEFNNGN